MSCLGKVFASVLILIIIISSLGIVIVEAANAQSIPKPSVPEFTSEIYGSLLDLAIQNQPLVFQYGGSFYYNIQVKVHNTDRWTFLYSDARFQLANNYTSQTLAQANNYTSQTLISVGNLTKDGLTIYTYPALEVPSDGQIDIQVEAMIGQWSNDVFVGQSSDWSPTQTITIPASSNSPTSTIPASSTSPTSTIPASSTSPTPTVSEFPTLIILPLFAVAILLSIVFIRKRIVIV